MPDESDNSKPRIRIVSSEDAPYDYDGPPLFSLERAHAMARADGRKPPPNGELPEWVSTIIPLESYTTSATVPMANGEDEVPAIGSLEKPARAPAEAPGGRLKLTRAADIAAAPVTSEWLMRPYLERKVLAMLYGEFGTLKSFIALEWALSIASGKPSVAFPDAIVKRGNVVLISAEGKGLWRRLRGWSGSRGVDLNDCNLWCIEHPVDTFSEESLLELAEAISALGIPVDLIIIDTLSRNAGPADENKTADMSAYLNGLDKLLRIPFGASVLLVHHVGHGAKDRARGSYTLMANTDANYLVERPDIHRLLIELKTGRLKDSEIPAGVMLEGKIIDLGTLDEDGEPETTLVLESTTERPKLRLKEPIGANQAAALAAIKAHLAAEGKAVILEREIHRVLRSSTTMSRQGRASALAGLLKHGYLKNSPMGGVEIADDE